MKVYHDLPGTIQEEDIEWNVDAFPITDDLPEASGVYRFTSRMNQDVQTLFVNYAPSEKGVNIRGCHLFHLEDSELDDPEFGDLYGINDLCFGYVEVQEHKAIAIAQEYRSKFKPFYNMKYNVRFDRPAVPAFNN